MTTMRRAHRALAAGSVLCLGACGTDAPEGRAPGIDSAAISQAAANAPAEWAGELGQLLVVPSDSEHAAVVIFPDFPSARLVASAPLTLVTVAGDTMSARAQLVATESEQCGGAPLVELRDSIPGDWSVGLLRRSVASLRTDSIESMTSADSIRLAGDLSKIGTALPGSESSRFGGLPFSVLSAHRLQDNGRDIVVAHLVRRLPQEASPLEEHVLILAERVGEAPLTPVYTHRSEGTEETAEHFELLAAARSGDRVLVILARDQVDATRYEVLERSAESGWRSRWARTLVC